jgi:hypothetical protein
MRIEHVFKLYLMHDTYLGVKGFDYCEYVVYRAYLCAYSRVFYCATNTRCKYMKIHHNTLKYTY